VSYRQRLEESFVLKDLKKYKDVPKFFSTNQHFFTLYPEVANELAYKWHVVDDETKEAHLKEMKSTLFKRRSRLNLLKDAYHMWRLMS
jgi:electron transfer flavoprotein-quinone oxidoreductase